MKVLIIRLSAIGDIFFCTSLARVLKEQHPACRITWLSEPVGASILEGHPLVDEVVTLPRKGIVADFKHIRWLSLKRRIAGVLEPLRRETFDLVIDPQGLLKSAIWARLAKAKRRIGVNGRDGSRYLYDETLRMQPHARPVILSEYRALVKRLGGDPEDVKMALHTGEAEQAEADAFLRENGADAAVVFCPFTTRPQKHWFAGDWAKLGDLLQEHGKRVILLGGPDDGEAAREIAGKMQNAPLIAAGEKRPVGFALGLIRRSHGLIGVDTGLTHAGIAFARPTIALFGSTRPYVRTGLPWGKVLYHDLDCAPCKRHPTCNGRFDCMRLHRPEAVMAAFREVVG